MLTTRLTLYHNIFLEYLLLLALPGTVLWQFRWQSRVLKPAIHLGLTLSWHINRRAEPLSSLTPQIEEATTIRQA